MLVQGDGTCALVCCLGLCVTVKQALHRAPFLLLFYPKLQEIWDSMKGNQWWISLKTEIGFADGKRAGKKISTISIKQRSSSSIPTAKPSAILQWDLFFLDILFNSFLDGTSVSDLRCNLLPLLLLHQAFLLHPDCLSCFIPNSSLFAVPLLFLGELILILQTISLAFEGPDTSYSTNLEKRILEIASCAPLLPPALHDLAFISTNRNTEEADK